MHKRVTIRDLANELGISDRAVSQALNPRESNVKLSPATTERVQKLAAKRNYLPDSRARAMRYERFYNIGYFEATQLAIHYPLLGADAGIFDAANERNYRIVVVKIPSNLSEKQNPIPLVFREAHLDAMIVSNLGNVTQVMKKIIDASHLPVVYLNEKKSYNSVYPDDQAGAEELTQYLILQGYRKIAFIQQPTNPSAHYSAADRLLGYTKAMEKAGLELRTVCLEPRDIQPYTAWLRENSDLEALICINDVEAARLFKVLYQMGVAVPREKAVACFGDLFSEECAVSLTSMHVPFYELGRLAVEMALELVEEPGKKLPSRIAKTSLIIRDSTPPINVAGAASPK